MLKVDELKFPSKLKRIIADEGSYEDDSFSPLLITVSELGHKGRVVMGYQLTLKAEEYFEEIEDLMYEAKLKINGATWEDLIRKHLKAKDPAFEKKIEGDTEGANCVLWTENEDLFRRLLQEVTAFVHDTAAARKLILG